MTTTSETITYTYDIANRLTSVNDSEGPVNYTWDGQRFVFWDVVDGNGN